MGIFELVLWNTEINNEKRVVMRSFYRRLAGVLLLTITLHTFTCASYPGADTFRGILKYIGNVFKEGSDEFDKHDPRIMKGSLKITSAHCLPWLMKRCYELCIVIRRQLT